MNTELAKIICEVDGVVTSAKKLKNELLIEGEIILTAFQRLGGDLESFLEGVEEVRLMRQAPAKKKVVKKGDMSHMSCDEKILTLMADPEFQDTDGWVLAADISRALGVASCYISARTRRLQDAGKIEDNGRLRGHRRIRLAQRNVVSINKNKKKKKKAG